MPSLPAPAERSRSWHRAPACRRSLPPKEPCRGRADLDHTCSSAPPTCTNNWALETVAWESGWTIQVPKRPPSQILVLSRLLKLQQAPPKTPCDLAKQAPPPCSIVRLHFGLCATSSKFQVARNCRRH